jgi:hypothetical protein
MQVGTAQRFANSLVLFGGFLEVSSAASEAPIPLYGLGLPALLLGMILSFLTLTKAMSEAD